MTAYKSAILSYLKEKHMGDKITVHSSSCDTLAVNTTNISK
jgi:hypothetical protein